MIQQPFHNSENSDNNMTSRRGQPNKDSDDYRRLRQRNNEAVKKSRTKSRVKQQQTQERVAQLRKEHDDLVRQVEILKHRLDVYKEIFLKQAGAQGEIELQQMDLTFLYDDDTMENHR